MIEDPRLELGPVAPEVREEFPELALACVRVEGRMRPSAPELRARMREASNRFTGAKAVALRQQPIPWAYRVFFRHIGIDPDESPTPVEALALERLRAGGFKSRNTLDDALVLATIETAVPVIAFDDDRLVGTPGIRLSMEGEPLGGGDGMRLPPRRLVIADGERALALLFGERADLFAPGRGTERVLIAAVRVKGVPDVAVEEALWTVAETVSELR